MVYDFFTGQIMQQDWINFYGMANTVCLLKPLFNDQKYSKLTQ